MKELRGPLETFGLASVVGFLASLEKTGHLRIAVGARAAEMDVQAGRIVGARCGPDRAHDALEAIALGLRDGEFVFADGPVEASELDLGADDLRAMLERLPARLQGSDGGPVSLGHVPRLLDPPAGQAPATDSVVLERGTLATLLLVDGRRSLDDIVGSRSLAQTLRELRTLVGLGLVRLDPPAAGVARPESAASSQQAPATRAPAWPGNGTHAVRQDALAPVPASTPAPLAPLSGPVAASAPGPCPKLGFADDPANRFSRPTQLHRCFAGAAPQRLTTQEQRDLCLTDQYPGCPRFAEAAGALPSPAAPVEETPRPGEPARPALSRGRFTLISPPQRPARAEPNAGEGHAGRVASAGSPSPFSRLSQAPVPPVSPPWLPPGTSPPVQPDVPAHGPREPLTGQPETPLRPAAQNGLESLSSPPVPPAPRVSSPAKESSETLGPRPGAEPGRDADENVPPTQAAQGTPVRSGLVRPAWAPVGVLLAVGALGTLLLVPLLLRPADSPSMDAAAGAGAAAPVARPATATVTVGGAGNEPSTASVPGAAPTSAAAPTVAALPPVAPSVDATPRATDQATAQRAPTAAPGPRTLLDARFASALPGWPNDPRGSAWFAEGGYRLAAIRPSQFVAIGAPLAGNATPRDVTVTGTFRKVGGPTGGGYGLILRDRSPRPLDGLNQLGQFYVLEVGDRGEVGIWRRNGERWEDLVPWTRSAAVRPGEATNELTARAEGGLLTFMVNGTQVASAGDTTLPDGGVGVFLGGDGNQAVLQRLLVQVPE